MATIEVNIDHLIRVLKEKGMKLSISLEQSKNSIGSIYMHFPKEEERDIDNCIAELDECLAECACEAAPINPFIKRYEQEQSELERLELDDLEYWEQSKVKREAEKQIKEANITNEDDKLKVYRNTKRQYLEYKEYLKG